MTFVPKHLEQNVTDLPLKEFNFDILAFLTLDAKHHTPLTVITAPGGTQNCLVREPKKEMEKS